MTHQGPHVLLCACGHWLYRHSSRTEPSAGGRTYVHCREPSCSCEVFRNHLGEGFNAGERRKGG